MQKMPVLIPLPIRTKGLSWFAAVWMWLTHPRKWKLATDWSYTFKNGTQVWIMKGFIFDGASIPRIAWGILNPIGILLIPGLLHDYGYRKNWLLILNPNKGEKEPTHIKYMEGAGKGRWDTMFFETSLEVNGFEIIGRAAYWAVRLGGGNAWRTNRALQKKQPGSLI